MRAVHPGLRECPVLPVVAHLGPPVTRDQYRSREIARMERALGYPPGYARKDRTRREIENEYEEMAARGLLGL